MTPNTMGRRVRWNTTTSRKRHIFSNWRNRRSVPAKRIVLICRLLQSACSTGSEGKLHCGSRPSIHHQAKIRPETSCVSKTRSFAVAGRWRVGVWRGDALAGCVELIAVEGTDEPASAYPASRVGPQVGAQVREIRLGYAYPPVLVTPNDDVFPHPGFLNEFGLLYGLTACDEESSLGK